ncbi:MAG TPA: DegT/DnrJ/EryC1/StrS family aminotransferase [Candidatus Nitrosotenuis sp.]|jgi:perosamine synthetase|nr:DegT/DnrJ/EryC1/StrS family aminotransferase [Candidatus Nitrosotenuis sp.]
MSNDQRIPLCRPSFSEEDRAAVEEVLRSGQWAGGPRVRAFEEAFAAYLGVPHACALNSCASALQLALETLPRRGEVILPSFTFAASANAVVKAGCRPVFADVDLATGNLDPRAAEPLVGEDTVALMVVHYAGLAADLPALAELCRRHSLVLVEDCAQAIGATVDGRMAGSFGLGCFSFFPTKNLSTGEGGMLTCGDPELDARVRRLRGHGVFRPGGETHWRRDVEEPGYNFRMTEMQGALGLSQLARLEEMNERRRHLAALYGRLLKGLPGVDLPFEPPGRRHVYQMYVVRLDPGLYQRDAVVERMRARGVEASVHFDPPLHRTRAYSSARRGDLARTETLARSVISLPMYPGLKEEEVCTVARVLAAALAG